MAKLPKYYLCLDCSELLSRLTDDDHRAWFNDLENARMGGKVKEIILESRQALTDTNCGTLYVSRKKRKHDQSVKNTMTITVEFP